MIQNATPVSLVVLRLPGLQWQGLWRVRLPQMTTVVVTPQVLLTWSAFHSQCVCCTHHLYSPRPSPMPGMTLPCLPTAMCRRAPCLRSWCELQERSFVAYVCWGLVVHVW